MNSIARILFAGSMLFQLAVLPVVARQPSVDEGKLQFRLPGLDGQVVSSSDSRFEDQVLLVNLWATWCPPCLTEIPALIELQDEFGNRGLVIVAVAFESEEQSETRRERLRVFGRERGINYLVLDGGLPEKFESTLPGVQNVTGLPVEILVDRRGRVFRARNSFGYKKGWIRKLKREIEGLLETPAEP